MSTSSLFNEFAKVSKEEWLAKIISDRKGAGVEELNWDFEGIKATPFYHREDLPSEHFYIGSKKKNNSWIIGEKVVFDKPKEGNKLILNALEQGVSAINIDLKKGVENDIGILFNEVQHEWISTHINLSAVDQPLKNIREFCNILTSRNQDPIKINGSIHLSKADVSYWIVLKEIFDTLPLFDVQININGEEDNSAVETLVSLLQETYTFFQLGQEYGFELSALFRKLKYTIVIGDNYYTSIVLLRSVRSLVNRLCQAYGVLHNPSIRIETWLRSSNQTNNRNYNLIKNTSQILGSIIGGADIIYPMTYSKSIQNEHHNQRISRNINHVLQLESYMDRVVDPAAGSYFFESMTEQLCSKVWKEFQNRVEV